MKTENLDKKLGIVGGGQLGKMLLSECSKMNISTSVLDPSEKSPCKSISGGIDLVISCPFITISFLSTIFLLGVTLMNS